MTNWSALETPLSQEPAFFVQAPDGDKHLTELRRVQLFRTLMRYRAPRVMVYANANAGKRNPLQATREGVVAGVFDYTVVWRGLVCWIEFKGYSKAGRPGHLSASQVEFGNRLVALDMPCASFFDPHAAVDWLAGIGFPVAAARAAA
jgi:hypothetical protein